MTAAGRGQPSPVPGPALPPGLHVELGDVVNLLRQTLRTPCRLDYHGGQNQKGGPGSRAHCAREEGKQGRGCSLSLPHTGAAPVALGLARKPQARPC